MALLRKQSTLIVFPKPFSPLHFLHKPNPQKHQPHSKTSSLPLLNPFALPKNSTQQRNPMSWTCKRCTFINSPPSKPNPTCQICLSPPSPPSKSQTLSLSPSIDTPKWPCKACTFLNLFKNTSCEICGTRAPVSSLSDFEDLDGDDGCDPSIGSVFRPLLRVCNNKRKERESDPFGAGGDDGGLGGFRGAKAPNVDASEKEKDGNRLPLGGFHDAGLRDKAVTVMKDDASSSTGMGTFKVLSYNVWFREDLEVHQRMKAIGDLIQLHSPDIICFQEVTPNIYDIFRQSRWWKAYHCSLSDDLAHLRSYFCMQLSRHPVKSFSTRPFKYTGMGRELCIVELEVHAKKSMVIATSHLESPCPGPPKWDQMFSKERVDQANEAVNYLKTYPNVIFCGDMNWDDKLDGQYPLPSGWVDAWTELRPGDDGWTYDTKSNKMLTGNRTLQKRLDRFLCSLQDFKISKIDMIGKEAMPGLAHIKEKKVRNGIKSLELPVLPSDHFGLLLTITDQ